MALRRSREILVAKKQGQVLGFAIVEWGSKDQNVFSLFDQFRLYVLQEEQKEEICRVLFARIFALYQKHHISTAICWSQDTSLVSYVPSGKVFHDAYYWIVKATRMQAFLRHLDRLHGRMDTLRSRRKRNR